MIHEYDEKEDFDISMPFGKYFKKARRLLGLNQTDMGEIVGVSQNTISMWEMGITSPAIEDARRIIRLLGGELLIVNLETREQREERIFSMVDKVSGEKWEKLII